MANAYVVACCRNLNFDASAAIQARCLHNNALLQETGWDELDTSREVVSYTYLALSYDLENRMVPGNVTNNVFAAKVHVPLCQRFRTTLKGQ